jgi:TonB family protein
MALENGRMRSTCLILMMTCLMVTHLPSQTRRSAGFTGRNPLCSTLFVPKQIGEEFVYPVGKGVSAPVLMKGTEPTVPSDKTTVKGVAIVCGIVARDGQIHTASIDRAIGNGLDEIAMDTVKQWKFRPAMKDGKPVAAPIDLQIKFGD